MTATREAIMYASRGMRQMTASSTAPTILQMTLQAMQSKQTDLLLSASTDVHHRMDISLSAVTAKVKLITIFQDIASSWERTGLTIAQTLPLKTMPLFCQITGFVWVLPFRILHRQLTLMTLQSHLTTGLTTM